jgi:membrane associated rhomboid family serine protease
LIIACAAVWLLQIGDALATGGAVTSLFGLTPAKVVGGYVWQLASYIFLHSTGGLLHILFNMLGLWMFGSQLESLWGSRQFLKFFFICGIGAGVLMVVLSLITGSGYNTMTIGASGAVYGVLLAFGVLFPDAIIYWIIFPIRAKWFVIIMGGIAFYSSLAAVGGGVAHVAHLGGMLCGLVYLRGGRMTGRFHQKYRDWKRARLRRKFEVYYNDRHKNDDQPWRWKN